jgi:hypothetical protein
MARLRRAGVVVVDEAAGPWRIGDAVVCDDGAVKRGKRRRVKAKGKKRAVRREARPAAPARRLDA